MEAKPSETTPPKLYRIKIELDDSKVKTEYFLLIDVEIGEVEQPAFIIPVEPVVEEEPKPENEPKPEEPAEDVIQVDPEITDTIEEPEEDEEADD